MARPEKMFPGGVFAGTADPNLLYLTQSMRRAYQMLIHAIRLRRGLITLTGDPGMGKTTLLRRITDVFARECESVFIRSDCRTFEELLGRIFVELGLEIPSTSLSDRIAALRAYALTRDRKNDLVVIVVDDAQRLDEDVLGELRILVDIESANHKLIQIVLCGDRELDRKLANEGLAAISQRVAVHAVLEPLCRNEVVGYVDERFKGAGARREDFFQASDLVSIWRAANGVPRAINTICDNALILAFARSRFPVQRQAVKEAIHLVNGKSGLLPDFARVLRALTLPLVVIGAFIVGIMSFAPAKEGWAAALRAARAAGRATERAAVAFADTVASGAAAVTRLADSDDANEDARLLRIAYTSSADGGASMPARPATRQNVSPARAMPAVALVNTAPRRVPRLGLDARCGDGYLDDGEECDDGNGINSDECLSNCRESVCGDGVLHADVEECDDGNARNDDDCLFGCLRPRRAVTNSGGPQR